MPGGRSPFHTAPVRMRRCLNARLRPRLFLVRGVKRIADLHGVAKRLIERERTMEWSPLDKLHDEVVRTDVVNLADVGMIQCCDCLSFSLKAVTELRSRDFDRDVAIQAWIVRLPHLSHPTFADGRKDFVRAEFVAYGKRH